MTSLYICLLLHMYDDTTLSPKSITGQVPLSLCKVPVSLCKVPLSLCKVDLSLCKVDLSLCKVHLSLCKVHLSLCSKYCNMQVELCASWCVCVMCFNPYCCAFLLERMSMFNSVHNVKNLCLSMHN